MAFVEFVGVIVAANVKHHAAGAWHQSTFEAKPSEAKLERQAVAMRRTQYEIGVIEEIQMRKLFVLVFSIAITFMCLVNVGAQDEKSIGLSREYETCMDKSGGVTSKMMDCIGTETTRQDARLNKVFKEAMAQLDATNKTRLRDAQKAWISFRDANVNFYADPNGGTAATVSGADRFLIMTAQRASELEKLKQ